MPTIAKLRDDLGTALKAARDAAADAEKAGRDFTDEERATVAKAIEDATRIKGLITKAGEDDELRSAIKALGADVGLVEGKADGAGSSGAPAAPGDKGTIGERFLSSDAWKAAVARFPGGRVSEKAAFATAPVGFKTLVTGLSDTSAGALVQSDFRGVLDAGAYARPLTIRDVITVGQTTSDTVEYVREGTPTNNAAPVAEALTAVAVGGSAGGSIGTVDTTEAGQKPESAIALSRVTATVKTVAHWIPATKRALSDAAQIRTLIDNFLRYGLEEELEDQIVTGSGSGENFEGIGTVSGTQSQAWDTDILTTTRKARTLVRTVGRAVATAYLLNPADWETIDLTQDNEGRYFFGGPARLGVPTLWGLPVVECEAVPAGTGYVGDFRRAVLWDREDATITVSDSHADFFIRNLVAILAEMRAAFGVLRPSAFVEIDLTA